MKKIVSLAIVLILALCLATTTFAAEPVQIYDCSVATEVPVAAGATETVTVYGFFPVDLSVSGTGDFCVVYAEEEYVAANGEVLMNGFACSRMGTSFTITNKGTAAATYKVVQVLPVGHMNNPDTLVLGENVADIPANSTGYFYNWTAPAAGELTVTMPAGNWTYAINNLTTGKYGDTQWNDSDPVVNPAVVTVAKGDELQIVVNNYNPADMWNVPAGKLTINALFECAEHSAVEVPAVVNGCHNNGNIKHWYCEVCNGYWADAELKNTTNALSVVLPATGAQKVEHIEAVEAGCHNNGNTEHWICGGCNGLFEDAACTKEILPATRVVIPATGTTSVTHVAATEAYCHRNGMQAHWICNDCGGYFTDAECTQEVMQPTRLVIPAEVTLEYHEKVNATCVENGMEEYWYCAECDCYFTDAEGLYNIASKRLVIEADGKSHVLEHHKAADPVCHRNGNVEYWYCGECDCYFTKVEGNLVNTNAKNVVILAANELEHHAAVAATCEKDGMAEYWYCDDCDCYFTDAEGIFNIASKRLVVPATGHNYVDGDCTVCGGDNPETGDMGVLAPIATLLVSAMSTVALVIKKKEF